MGRSADLPRGLARPTGARPDDTGCGILHVDMDAFFASVEIRDNPDLAGKPVVVGGAGPRGVVAAASYEARRFGVRSAMPGSRARALCPSAVFVAPRHDRYAEVSRGVMEIFRSITPLVEPLSLDEAFLDVTGALRLLGMSPAGIGHLIRAEVFDAHAVTCSVGVAPSKFLAKLASGLAKPDGLLVVPADGVLDFLHPLPVSALWGVGPKTAAVLTDMGLRTVGEIARTPEATLRSAVGAAAATHLLGLAAGSDTRAVIPETAEKSIGAEETFALDVVDRTVLNRELLRLAERTAATLRRKGLSGRTVAVKIRFPDFTTISRSRTVSEPLDGSQALYRVARELVEANVPRGARVRLVGVRVEQLCTVPAARQLALGERESGWSDAERAADRARNRFGTAAIRPASLLPDGNPPAVPRSDRHPESAG